MNLSHDYKSHPFDPFSLESEVPFCPTLSSMVRKKTSDSETKMLPNSRISNSGIGS